MSLNLDESRAVRDIPDLLKDLASKQETANLIGLANLEMARDNKMAVGNLMRTIRARLGVDIAGERLP